MKRCDRKIHASQVLPPELIAEIQRYVSNVYLRIPPVDPDRHRERNEQIYEQVKAGVPRKVIAKRFGISERWLYHVARTLRLAERYGT